MSSPDVSADDIPAPSTRGRFVAFSELVVPASGAAALANAFGERLREVEKWPGFSHLEAWQDERDVTRFALVSWWEDAESFRIYMRSDSHRRSHDRIPAGADRPRPVSFTRYRVVAR